MKTECAVFILCIIFTGAFGELTAEEIVEKIFSEKYFPPSVADPSYPNTTCAEKNFAYIASINRCFRVCPEKSSGYYPNCTCDDKLAGFNKNFFKCSRCPVDSDENRVYPDCNCKNVGEYNAYHNACKKCAKGSTGIFPNCSCDDVATVFNKYRNACETCPSASSGKIPDCVCHNGGEYDAASNKCQECPYGTKGEYPKCECYKEGGYFDGKKCKFCPWNSSGAYGNCNCNDDEIYVNKTNQCEKCPSKSTGIYPQCTCNKPHEYDEKRNLCFKCPKNSNGTYPNCKCTNGKYHPLYSQCIECPEKSKGTYPNCSCEDEGQIFSAYINECYTECGNGSIGLHPHCKCDTSRTYYEPKEFACKSNFGRACPPESFGIGPDCICIEELHSFHEHLWSCDHDTYFLVPYRCPDPNQKYPQCSGVDHNALLSLIG